MESAKAVTVEEIFTKCKTIAGGSERSKLNIFILRIRLGASQGLGRMTRSSYQLPQSVAGK